MQDQIWRSQKVVNSGSKMSFPPHSNGSVPNIFYFNAKWTPQKAKLSRSNGIINVFALGDLINYKVVGDNLAFWGSILPCLQCCKNHFHCVVDGRWNWKTCWPVMTKSWRRYSSLLIRRSTPLYVFHRCFLLSCVMSSAGFYTWSMTTAFQCSIGHTISSLTPWENVTFSGARANLYISCCPVVKRGRNSPKLSFWHHKIAILRSLAHIYYVLVGTLVFGCQNSVRNFRGLWTLRQCQPILLQFNSLTTYLICITITGVFQVYLLIFTKHYHSFAFTECCN